MARRRSQEKPVVDELFGLLVTVPTWVGPILAVTVYAVSRWVLPWILAVAGSESTTTQSMWQVFSMFASGAAPLLGIGVLVIWAAAEVKKWGDRRRVERQSGAQSIDALDWREFESLLAEAFRRQGFVVEHSGSSAPDGGVDHRLVKAGATTLVQCKHWRRRQVGVQIVRELLGVVTSEGAQSGIVVTSGRFTPDAIAFAARNPIRLIDGGELVRMIGEVQTSGRIARPSENPSDRHQQPASADGAFTEPKCPRCGATMIRRVAKTGPHAGSPFFGCSRYPACRGVRQVGPTEV